MQVENIDERSGYYFSNGVSKRNHDHSKARGTQLKHLKHRDDDGTLGQHDAQHRGGRFEPDQSFEPPPCE